LLVATFSTSLAIEERRLSGRSLGQGGRILACHKLAASYDSAGQSSLAQSDFSYLRTDKSYQQQIGDVPIKRGREIIGAQIEQESLLEQAVACEKRNFIARRPRIMTTL
jgi:hypothetical protein